jgi:hypothetical protein
MPARGERSIEMLLALSPHLLILLGLVGMVMRQGHERMQVLPALLIGTGLLLLATLRRRRRRRELLTALRRERGLQAHRPAVPSEGS